MAIALQSGVLYVTGTFSADLTVTGTGGTTTPQLAHAGSGDIFLAGFEFATGQVKWSVRLGGAGAWRLIRVGVRVRADVW